MSIFIEVQTMGQNTGNWKHDIKSEKHHINPSFVKRISPRGECFNVWMEGDDQQYSTCVIDKESFLKLTSYEPRSKERSEGSRE